MERFDVAIIGTGPAGVSAAITAHQRNKKVLLVGSGVFGSKVRMAERIQNYPGLPDISGEELANAFEHHLECIGQPVTDDSIKAVYPAGDYFLLQGLRQNYEADSVILAMGVVVQNSLSGEKEFVGRGVSYCATCDAQLYRGRTVAAIGYSEREEEEAAYLAEIAGKVLYFPVYEGEPELPDNVEIIRERPVSVGGTETVSKISTANGSYLVDGIFILREAVPPAQLLHGIALEGNFIRVDRKMQTSIEGCFACGDITGTPYQYVKSAGEGNVAALSAVSYLAAR